MTLRRNELNAAFGGRTGPPSGARRRGAARKPGRQDGTFAVMCAASLAAMLAICALALDIGKLYNRKAELHGIAKAAALAAARELNGTAGGVTKALDKARQTAEALTYKYGVGVTWSDAAISFSDAPDGGWVDASSASGSPSTLSFARVDTGGLDASIGSVTTVVMQMLGGSAITSQLADRAVAGRMAINVTPLAICAMSPLPGDARTNPGDATAVPPVPATVELLQYGFRRGVSYDLMQLNPDGTDAKNYVIDPLLPPGSTGSSSGTSASLVSPFVCTGTMWMPRVTGGPIHVSSPFPIDSLYRQLNSRFDQFNGNVCSPNGAPPDYNVKQYDYTVLNGASWMRPYTGRASAETRTDRGRRETVADLPAPPAGTPAGNFGPLWAYARAVKFSSYVPGSPEPSGGYTTFNPNDWRSLYYLGPGSTPASPIASGYPTSTSVNTPYKATSGSYYASPSAANTEISKDLRRVMNVPLLSCPVPSGSGVQATVLAVGKFFMTAPATATSIIGEFAGIVPEQSLTGQVELYQ